jgi:hypothetical protein
VSGSAAADTESADTESADPESKVSSEVGTLADSTHVAAEAQETARQALENAQRVPTNVVPGSAVNRETGHGSAGKRGLAAKDAIKKADPGTAWLKKFNH